jgi:hypothetical protein
MLFEMSSTSMLLYLGMIVVASALLIVYFESRLREQNYKLKTMLSLITTLAEDTTGIKQRLKQNHSSDVINDDDSDGKIEVSDGGDDEDEDSDLIEIDDLEDDSDDESEGDDTNDEEEVDDDETSTESEDDSSIADIEEIDEDYVDKNIKVLKLNNPIDEVLSDNVEDQMGSSEKNDDEVDYKQMPVAKLRDIASEKGIENASKMKKSDLLKILL